jgi:Cd2+/Zn2+-exporting ATPase
MQKYIIKNIDCPNCALKLEEEINKLPQVNFASINFAESILTLDTSDLASVKKTIKRSEPNVELMERRDTASHKFDLKNYINKEALAILSIALFYIAGLFFDKQIRSISPAAELLFFLILYLISGWNVLYNAGKKILRGKFFDEHFLMSLATLGAFVIGEYPEAVGVMLFYLIGEYFQKMAVDKSRSSIKALLEVKPNKATVIRDGKNIDVPPESVKTGEVILVKAGEKIPLDGIVESGNSYVDTSALTGEPMPKSVSTQSEVLAGMINTSGALTIKAARLFEESSISKLLHLVENAVNKKAETEKFISKFAKYYTPAVVGAASLIAILPPVIYGASFADWFYRALVILVISCPCALVISIPLGYFGGIGGASKKGILIKGSNYLDVLNEVDTVVFDKTGTLTKGSFKVTEIKPRNGIDSAGLIKLAAITESGSNHPIAKSITNAYGKPVEKISFSRYEEVPGLGIKAEYSGTKILAGNDKLLHRENIAHPHDDCNVSGAVVHIASNGKYQGYILISDELKEDAALAVKLLKENGVGTVGILTGDEQTAAEYVRNETKADFVKYGLLPEEKVSEIEKLLRIGGGKTAFVGDGINDAPVIARADVGIAMGALGSDLAIETADVVIMSDKPSKIPEAIRIAKKTRKIVWQNIAFAMGVKAFFIILGAMGIASMWEAVFGDMGVALIAIANSARALK